MKVSAPLNPQETDRGIQRAAGWSGTWQCLLNIVLACGAVALEVYYSVCGGACSYLKGTIFGIDLQYVGIAYMACVILLSILKWGELLPVLLSAGVGIEFYLIGFQVWYDTYCPYCLGFAAIVFFLFLLNFKRKRKALYAIAMVISLVVFAALFKGSSIPTYACNENRQPPAAGRALHLPTGLSVV
jgi:uncharacterized membrane protein